MWFELCVVLYMITVFTLLYDAYIDRGYACTFGKTTTVVVILAVFTPIINSLLLAGYIRYLKKV